MAHVSLCVSYQSSAQTAVEDSERIFTEMIRSIERRRSEEIAELKRRDAELEQLSHTEDHIHFLKKFQSVSNTAETKHVSSTCVNQSLSFEAVEKSVSSLKGQLEDFCKEEFMKISAAVTEVQTILLSEPSTREEFLQYSCDFTLDPNTANRNLHLSEGNRRVEWRDELQSYADHPERFDMIQQVLCREGVSGRCYWEVEWRGKDGIEIAVSYKSISRIGGGAECVFGCNDQSWSLILRSSSCSFWHNSKRTELPLVASSRIGVYVDHRTGTLAFYSISDTKILLHRVQTKFTHKLYPGFWVGEGSSVKLL
ncbi:hypothetical protein AALO_G00072460 [Alosa alosa]|uniref:B30.2/SPRY domain-containing protein n=1 Tax=Alosa alosa TaxID=278164 RepID=A0AAV6H2U9_9TELE|nr:hypothetical protein AALO_G00072460 [Alosa alosa]